MAALIIHGSRPWTRRTAGGKQADNVLGYSQDKHILCSLISTNQSKWAVTRAIPFDR
jgi:hypothetical protein